MGFAAALVVPASLLVAPSAGAADASPRVVNGREPLPGETSALVYVRAGGSVCSGTLVDPSHVITAGHCAAGAGGTTKSPASFTVGWSATGVLPPTMLSSGGCWRRLGDPLTLGCPSPHCPGSARLMRAALADRG